MPDQKQRKTLYDAYGDGGLEGAKADLDRTGYLDNETLALVLEKNPELLPDWLGEYLIKRLRGQARKKPGPAAAKHDEFQAALLLLARLVYARALRSAQFIVANNRRASLERGDKLPKAEAAAYELALEVVQKRMGLFRHMSREGLHNLLSRGSKP